MDNYTGGFQNKGPSGGGAVEGTDVLSTGEAGGTKFLREDGDGTSSWQTPAGGGDVSKVGTPVDSQVGVWTGDGTIEGDADFTFDTSTNTFALAGSAGTSIVAVGGANILVDSPRGTMTLSNVDAIDATTETTLEAAIDTLSNLTTVGALDSGSITSGFTSIDVGAGSIDGGVITADTNFAGDLTGNVTGNCSGTAATVTGGTQASITTCSNLVTVGALDSGSITSGFGAINNASTIEGTVGTFTAASSLVLGTASTNTGAIILKNSTNANNTTIQAGAAGAALTFTLPTDDGDANEFLQTNGSGVLSWAAAGGGGGTAPTRYYFAGELAIGTLIAVPIEGDLDSETISDVRISSPVEPDSGETFDIQVTLNGIATTDSIFTSDTPVSLANGTTIQNGLYRAGNSTIDNGALSTNDTLYIRVTDSGGAGQQLLDLNVIIEY